MMRYVTDAAPMTDAAPALRSGQPQAATSRSLPRFVITGGLSFGVDAGSLYVAHGIAGIWLPLATVLAYALAFTVNFSLNRLWAFGSTGPVGRQVVRYITLTGVNCVLTVVMVSGFAAVGVHYLLAKAMAATVIAILNYIAYRMWVFR